MPLHDPESSKNTIEEKILFVFEHFPRISPSMLQITVGSGLPTAVWHPVLEDLISREEVYRYQKRVRNPKGRTQLITVLSRHPLKDDDPEFLSDSD